MLASTLERMPLGLRPFGPTRSGMKTLLIDAPPRRIVSSTLTLLAGGEGTALSALGYHRVDATQIDVDLPFGFVLDGEHFPPGSYHVRSGTPVSFLRA
ncbi:hypothetical protein H5J25_04535 [Sphingomonas aliaeris]|uniref:Uncharacterized protein n=2 Tax=Sphingomonas aliaeris TaxID=2759526 RepID=A0A974S4V2_9SPHN|nr:hypothetical protein H5J25_04535 [Sphingomonas aliaeris]